MAFNEGVKDLVGICEHAVGEKEDGGKVGTWGICQLREEGGEGVHMGSA